MKLYKNYLLNIFVIQVIFFLVPSLAIPSDFQSLLSEDRKHTKDAIFSAANMGKPLTRSIPVSKVDDQTLVQDIVYSLTYILTPGERQLITSQGATFYQLNLFLDPDRVLKAFPDKIIPRRFLDKWPDAFFALQDIVFLDNQKYTVEQIIDSEKSGNRLKRSTPVIEVDDKTSVKSVVLSLTYILTQDERTMIEFRKIKIKDLAARLDPDRVKIAFADKPIPLRFKDEWLDAFNALEHIRSGKNLSTLSSDKPPTPSLAISSKSQHLLLEDKKYTAQQITEAASKGNPLTRTSPIINLDDKTLIEDVVLSLTYILSEDYSNQITSKKIPLETLALLLDPARVKVAFPNNRIPIQIRYKWMEAYYALQRALIKGNPSTSSSN